MEHNLTLPKSPTLKDYQTYVRELEQARGFSSETLLAECLRLGEEIGELFKAIRKQENLSYDHNSKVSGVAEELADIMIYLCSIANRCNVDLEAAFRAKEELNKKRIWQKDSQQ